MHGDAEHCEDYGAETVEDLCPVCFAQWENDRDSYLENLAEERMERQAEREMERLDRIY